MSFFRCNGSRGYLPDSGEEYETFEDARDSALGQFEDVPDFDALNEVAMNADSKIGFIYDFEDPQLIGAEYVEVSPMN